MASSNFNPNKSNLPYYIFCFFVFCMNPLIGILLFLARFIPYYNNQKKRNNGSQSGYYNQGTPYQNYNRNGYSPQQGNVNQQGQQWAPPGQPQWGTQQPRQGQPQWTAQQGQQWAPQQPRQGQPQWTTQQPRQPIPPQRDMNLVNKFTSPNLGRKARVIGGILSGIFAVMTLMVLFEDFYLIGMGQIGSLLAELSFLLPVSLAFGYLSLWGHKKSKKAARCREYLTIIGNSSAVALRELSRITNTPYEQVRSDISELVANGVFGATAYVDMSSQYLILNEYGKRKVAEHLAAARKQRTPEPEKATPLSKEAEASKEASILREIRQVNDEIADPRLSEQIDRIEEITRLILRYQEDHPEQAGQLRSFLSYYLPTTLKILNSYAELERQSYQGKNITETRQRIEDIMDKVVTGFETQLDQLFANSRIDITSEITVLENMLRKDGLTSDTEDPFGDVLAQGF